MRRQRGFLVATTTGVRHTRPVVRHRLIAIGLKGGSVGGRAPRPSMNESELREILQHLEAVKAVYEKHEGPLNAVEASLKSLTATLHSQTKAQLDLLKGGSWWSPR